MGPQQSDILRKPQLDIVKAREESQGKVENVGTSTIRDRNAAEGKTESSGTEATPQKDCFEALNASHATLTANLQRTKTELSEKEELLKTLEEDLICNREKMWLMEERVRLITEKLACVSFANGRKEKKSDKLFAELSDVKWKFEEGKKTAMSMKENCLKWKSELQKRKEQLSDLTNEPEEVRNWYRELVEETSQLKRIKEQLQAGDSEPRSILDGTKICELEDRKRYISDAIIENSATSEALLLDVDETVELIKSEKEALEDAKKRHEDLVKDRKNHLNFLNETERRLKKNLTYTKSRLDTGMLPPTTSENWANVRESYKYKI